MERLATQKYLPLFLNLERNPSKYKTKEGCKKLVEILKKKPIVLEEVKKTLKQKLINFLQI
jgi:hypothetical protein